MGKANLEEKMKSIIQMLYDGDIYPVEQIVPRDPGYRQLSHAVEEEKEYIKEKLSNADATRYCELEAMMCDLSDMGRLAYFEYGIKFGIGLMVEIKDMKINTANLTLPS
jgi:hypothetical protein